MILPNLIYAFESKKSIGDALNVRDVGENVGENVGEESFEKKLIVLIKDNPYISQREMAALIGKTTKTVERIIKASKRIKRSGPDKGGHWEIIDKISH